jgi:hypothetical protein
MQSDAALLVHFFAPLRLCMRNKMGQSFFPATQRRQADGVGEKAL